MPNTPINKDGLKPLVSLVGSGPGAIDLLTIRALNRIKEADIILYDALISEPLLDETKVDCEKIYTGKLFQDGQDQRERQIKIHELMAQYYNEGHRVVRLKSGDPMIFGRAMEEIRFLEKNNIPWEVIPGVTAGIAAAGLNGVPLTERGKSRLVLFTTAYTETGEMPEDTPWLATLKDGGSVVFYMALSKLNQLTNRLKYHSLADTMVAICNNVAHPEQVTFKAPSTAIVKLLSQEKLEGPSVIILYRESKNETI